MSDLPADQDSELLIRERARGSKLENAYKKKKGRIVAETQHTVTMKERGKSLPTLYSKREVASSRKLATSQKKPQNALSQSQCATTSQPINEREPEISTQPKITPSLTTPQKKATKRIPVEFKRLHNWRQLLLDSDEYEDERRERKTAETSAIKVTVNWVNHKNRARGRTTGKDTRTAKR